MIFFLSIFNFPGIFPAFTQTPAAGNLVIAGGGLEADNKSVYGELIRLAGGASKAAFAVIPSAGGSPVQSYMWFRNTLVSYGVSPENIHLIPVAVMDDDSTTDVNESFWRDNGNDPKLAETIRKCTAVWFTGGDQLRTTRTLYRFDGSLTPVLEAVWEVYRSGGVIGGTSAGAAIMSDPMIGAGTGLAALEHGVVDHFEGEDFPEDSGVLVTRGLGFFPLGMVDQHFLARARIGRLATVLMTYRHKLSMAFGIDENTALIYEGNSGMINVAGASGVVVLSNRESRIVSSDGKSRIENLSVGYLEKGDRFDPATGKAVPAAGKEPVRGKEKYSDACCQGSGALSSFESAFYDLITRNLADNKVNNTVSNLTPADENSGFLLTLRKTEGSEVYRSSGKEGRNHYTILNIFMDITPVSIAVTPAIR